MSLSGVLVRGREKDSVTGVTDRGTGSQLNASGSFRFATPHKSGTPLVRPRFALTLVTASRRFLKTRCVHTNHVRLAMLAIATLRLYREPDLDVQAEMDDEAEKKASG